MKLSSNSISMLIFTALATAVFVLMALRPAVEGNAMNLGMPAGGESMAAPASTEKAMSETTTTETEAAPAMSKEPEAATAETMTKELMSKEVVPAVTETVESIKNESSSAVEETETMIKETIKDKVSN